MLGRILPFRLQAAFAGAPTGVVHSMSGRGPSRPFPSATAAPRRADAATPKPGDAERFRRLVMPHLDGAYDFARYLCRDPTAAEDIVQEAFLQAWRGFGGLRGDNVRAWLFAIVRNCCFSSSRARSPTRGTTPEMLEGLASDYDDPEVAMLRLEEAETVRALIEALPEPFREALVLRELEELCYREIAEITSAPIGTVMSRLARARQMLVASLGLAGGGVESR